MLQVKSKTADDFEPHFINVTNSVFLDSNARTSVRSQVMREYHRRRTQKKDGTNFIDHSTTRPWVSLNAKSQTQKFRLDGKKAFQAWAPVISNGPEVAEITGDRHDNSKGRKVSQEKLRNKIKDTLPSRQPTFEILPTDRSPPGIMKVGAVSELDSIETRLEELQGLLEGLSLPTINPITQPPSSGLLDPFDSMSLVLDSRTQLLLHHYFNQRLQSSWLMMPMRKGLFSTAIHDAALFHTFLAHYVASYDLRYGSGDPEESLRHRMEAVRIVNERLADIPRALSDGTIATVANIAVYEAGNGSLKSMVVHLKGLEEMVNMRGGTENGGFDPNVRRLIAWTDVHCANALAQPTRFPPLSVAIAPGSQTLLQNSKHYDLNSSTTEYISTLQTSPQEQTLLDWTLAEVRNISLSLQHIKNCSSVPKEDIRYSDRVYYAQYCLLQVLHNPETSQLDTALSIVGLIYCAVCFRDMSFNFRVIGESVIRLKYILEFVVNDRPYDSRECEKLFWVLMMGGMAAEGKEERSLFVVDLSWVCGLLSINMWETAKLILEGIAWQSELDSFGIRLWKEVFG
ncbi:hypothetical protein EG329_002369 [Mollisiaceae sp. DMI_Dod_QoI]|nr:hypothetical protein EG329_002369 [Helotiales sp. DMI_Dod_QoI]